MRQISMGVKNERKWRDTLDRKMIYCVFSWKTNMRTYKFRKSNLREMVQRVQACISNDYCLWFLLSISIKHIHVPQRWGQLCVRLGEVAQVWWIWILIDDGKHWQMAVIASNCSVRSSLSLICSLEWSVCRCGRILLGISMLHSQFHDHGYQRWWRVIVRLVLNSMTLMICGSVFLIISL